MPAFLTGPVARTSLLLGVSITAASFAALLIILGLYFAEAIPHPGLYWAALWGFPVGFALMCLYLVANLKARRRLAGSA
ncbi:hypothetical protein [Nesterenkonia ebinurensis]|uniref:hypothetical protein n=1 Tax=Nesterenkonia ebinurensis TaxID=2608252 RepID=UPI00123CF6B6|nr:hypothetical protein [Nesterenkonia ebinurensis]